MIRKAIIILFLVFINIIGQIEDHTFKCQLDPNENLNKLNLNKITVTGNYNITYVLCVENGQSTHFSSDYITQMKRIDNYFSTVSYDDITVDNVDVLVDSENPDGSVEAFELSGLLSSSSSYSIFVVPQAMVEDVLDSADTRYDFADYDYDSDGTVDMLVFMIARYELYDPSGNVKYSTGTTGLPYNLVYTTLDTTSTGVDITIDGSGYLTTSGDNAIVERARASSGDVVVGISVHELGHSWFNFPDTDHKGNDHYDHWAFGCFDEMTNGRGFHNRASLYNPAFRLGKDWGTSNLQEITSSTQITFDDYDETGDIYYYDIPDHSGISVGGQRIYLTAYTKPSTIIWQEFWPIPELSGDQKGLMIWRENRNLTLYSTSDFENAIYPPVNIDAAHGKWIWDNIDLSDPAPADRRPINTGVEDPLFGRDSLEAYFSYYYEAFNGYDGSGDPIYVGTPVYSDWRVGSTSCFFTPFSSSQEYAFYTNPNSCAQRSSDSSRSIASGFKLENIHESNGNIVVDVKVGDDANVVSDDVTLEKGVWSFYNNVTINSGVTLTIQDSTDLIFYNGSSLKVYGGLDINGTSSNPVTCDFQSINNSNGIYCYSGSNVNIDHAIIENGQCGLKADHCSPIIKNTTFNNLTFGVYSYYSTPNIQACNFEDTYWGIHLYRNPGYPVILQNNFYKTNNTIQYGIYLYYSSGKIRGNDISGFDRGIYCNYLSSPNLGEGGYYGNNKIYNNQYGLYAYNNSDPFLGIHSCTIQGTHNSIYNNTSYNVYVLYNGSYVLAEDNWWGSNPPNYSKFYVGSGGSLDYYPYLTSNPLPKIANNSLSPEEFLYNDNFNTLSKVSGEKIYNYDKKWPLTWKIRYIRNLVSVEDYKFAQELCEDIIDEYPDSMQAQIALNLHLQASKNDDMDSFVKYLSTKVDDKKTTNLQGMIELLLEDLNSSELKKYDKYDKLLDKYANKEMEEIILFNKFMYYLNDLDDTKSARIVSDELDKKFKNSNLAFDAHNLLGDNVVNQTIFPKAQVSESIEELPTSYELLGNYPNPFNPTTTIQYTMPYVSNVYLTIYDITGKIVKSFEINSQSAGKHEINWNATNDSGVKVSSGIYFYKIKAVSQESNGQAFEKTAKLLLLK